MPGKSSLRTPQRLPFFGVCLIIAAVGIGAAAGVSFYHGVGPLSDTITSLGQGDVVYEISTILMGPIGGVLAMIGVIACPITSGDTAFRSARLTIADWFHIDQSSVTKRAALSVPLLAVGVFIATSLDFNVLWRYFSWSKSRSSSATGMTSTTSWQRSKPEFRHKASHKDRSGKFPAPVFS